MNNMNIKRIKRFNPMILTCIGLAALFWALDTVTDVYIFHEGKFSAQRFHPEPLEF